MYSGLLPKGLTEEDLSPDEEDGGECSVKPPGCPAGPSTAETASAHGGSNPQTGDMPGVPQEMWRVSPLSSPRSNSAACAVLSCKILKMFPPLEVPGPAKEEKWNENDKDSRKTKKKTQKRFIYDKRGASAEGSVTGFHLMRSLFSFTGAERREPAGTRYRNPSQNAGLHLFEVYLSISTV